MIVLRNKEFTSKRTKKLRETILYGAAAAEDVWNNGHVNTSRWRSSQGLHPDGKFTQEQAIKYGKHLVRNHRDTYKSPFSTPGSTFTEAVQAKRKANQARNLTAALQLGKDKLNKMPGIGKNTVRVQENGVWNRYKRLGKKAQDMIKSARSNRKLRDFKFDFDVAQ